MRGNVGRADVLRLLMRGGEVRAAEALGYAYQAPEKPSVANDVEQELHTQRYHPDIVAKALAPVPQLFPDRFRAIEPKHAHELPELIPAAFEDWSDNRPWSPPERLLLPNTLNCVGELTSFFQQSAPGGRFDFDAAVSRIAGLQTVTELPRLNRPAAPDALVVITDTSRDMIPFHIDFEAIRAALPEVFPGTELIALNYSAELEEFLLDGQDEIVPVPAPKATLPTLYLGDPTLAGRGELRRLGRNLHRNALSSLALCPSPISTRIATGWDTLPLDSSPTPAFTEAIIDALLTYAAPALRLEPELLRALRLRFLPMTGAWLEALVWRSNHLASDHPTAATLTPDASDRFRATFLATTSGPSGISDGERRDAVELIWSYHGFLPEEIYFEEVLALGPKARTWLRHPEDQDVARLYYARIDTDQYKISSEDRDWLKRVARRIEFQEAPQSIPELRDLVRPFMADANESYEPNLPSDAPPFGDPLGTVSVHQTGGRLTVAPPNGQVSGSVVAVLPSENGVIEVADPFAGIWGADGPPEWVADFGIDQYGKWASFEVNGIEQRLRWIEPGQFLMGSPEDEDGHWDGEGPQTEITFERGFWLMDTTVTQAFWQAVMGDNPSHFADPGRPVERVAWPDVRRFIEKLNHRFAGLSLRLPSEAEWEYACRAGTTKPFAFGNEARREDIHFEATETCDVKTKPPNAWGLYQMHGNVWECCADVWYENHAGADPHGSARDAFEWDKYAPSVIRGGGWGVTARLVRAAYRTRFYSDVRDDGLGFRFAGGSVVNSGRLETDASGREVEPRSPLTVTDRAKRGKFFDVPAKAILTAGGTAKPLMLPQAPFLIRTDRAELQISRLTGDNFAWADAFGRDRFGLWAEIAVDDVRQRLRWIPPGRFWMGSPEDEPGRTDREGPQTEITFEQGYWLFDTPVTQALWDTVMEENPSLFRSGDRPVESVDLREVHKFNKAMNARLPDFALRLPSEAEWEYACRAGTVTATYAGPLGIIGERHAPILDAIAWYGGNSGQDWDLDDGYDISVWKEKQYDDTEGGTHPVARKRPNALGLYDMLGNVWDWCDDVWSETHDGADPEGQARQADSQQDALHVIRGGGWYNTARDVRAAYRNRSDPGNRGGGLGFRCAGGPVVSSGEPGTDAFGREAEPRPAPAGSARA